jgi:5-methyltetrahydrofolate--homocysteine methyltransferase
MKKISGSFDYGVHVIEDYDMNAVVSHINEKMLYNKHLGITKDIAALEDEKNEKFLKLKTETENLLKKFIEEKIITAQAIYKFFYAKKQGDSISLFDSPDEKVSIETFSFKRQPSVERLCLSDYIDDENFVIALFACTCGKGISKKAEELREKGEFSASHILQILSITCAEALAESLHADIRKIWKIENPDISLNEKIQTKYQGKRYSFGYPSCPNLENQHKLFKLLSPEKIGITLTSGCMMEPEQSVSAMVFTNPKCKYFSVY